MESTDFIDVLTMQVEEKRIYTVTYTGRLPDGVTISTVAVSAINEFTGVADASILSSASATPVGDTATIGLQLILSGQRYVVTFLASTTNVYVKLKDDILIIGDEI